MKNEIKELQKMIDESNNIVFFGGAGVSTESGIKDFRSKDGLYNEKYSVPPETILSAGYFYANTEGFYKFYRDKLNCLDKEPNVTHKYLAKLEKKGKLKCVITQNIDGLHQKAGSKKVYELHGSIYRNYCIKCNKFYEPEYIFNSKGVPKCECGGIIKPDVVLYEEGLDDETVEKAISAISRADMLIVGGTSLTVHPASGLINFYRGDRLVLINKDATMYDSKADLVINDSLGKVFEKIL
jgi:NAD-dependent deacetylase